MHLAEGFTLVFHQNHVCPQVPKATAVTGRFGVDLPRSARSSIDRGVSLGPLGDTEEAEAPSPKGQRTPL